MKRRLDSKDAVDIREYIRLGLGCRYTHDVYIVDDPAISSCKTIKRNPPA